jgi:hypothetical protein
MTDRVLIRLTMVFQLHNLRSIVRDGNNNSER